MKKILKAFSVVSLLIATIGCSTSKVVTETHRQHTKIFLDSIFNEALGKNYFPGAQIVYGNKREIIFDSVYGFQDLQSKKPVKYEDVYDLASMSKVLGATTVSMKLISEKRLKLSDQLGEVVPKYKNTDISDLTLFELLTHTSGLKAMIAFYQKLLKTPNNEPIFSKEASLNYVTPFDGLFVHKDIFFDETYLKTTPQSGYIQVYKNLWLSPEFYTVVQQDIAKGQTLKRGEYLYSDLNLILIQQMVESVAKQPLDVLANAIYKVLDLKTIGFNPLNFTTLDNVIPTEYDPVFRKDTLRGFVHDESAAILGGVSGNAGLFANARAVAVMCQLYLNKGKFNGKQVLNSKVVKEFINSPLAKKGIYRGLGFDKRKPNETYSAAQFGHTGFTGTFFFMDPKKDVFLVVLANRVSPTRANRLMYNEDFNPKIWRYLTAKKP